MPLRSPLLLVTLALLAPQSATVTARGAQELAFTSHLARTAHAAASRAPRCPRVPASSTSPPEDDVHEDDDDEEAEPGTMRVLEIKAELDMRRVTYTDCFDKESLVARLQEARASGKADPDILNEFNKRKLEETFQGQKVQVVQDDVMQQAVANDGTLPGGMSPDALKSLVANPEIMSLLQSTKMQDAMKLMMTGGQEDLERAMADDPEMRDIVSKLNSVLKDVQ